MNNTKIITNLVIVLLLVVVGVVGYMYFFGSSGTDITKGVQTVKGNPSDTSASGVVDKSQTSEFVILLDNLKSVDLKSDIFSNQAFAAALQDFTTPLPDRPKGRTNPFAPFGTNNTPSTQ